MLFCCVVIVGLGGGLSVDWFYGLLWLNVDWG